ncbi:MAG: molybdopterin converting factor subunit 1 [Gammaproteobacteria bacterium]|nr:molybdopterin converting factor subunit 1 [Gammaproteobacteria bacterium]
MIKILYFARLREQLGAESEELAPGAQTRNIEAVIKLLRSRGGEWAQAFSGEHPVLMALNQEVVGPDSEIEDGDEVAFFPPVTGG